ncbi:hypothetical protein ACCO45_009824 [Purpureocillium lilacinum]|uniref:Uncharacterized protein n=1 Tax=Purpureocillium lilacinum TaxID=33203 RepID=A0ACC4DNV2_PURLI
MACQPRNIDLHVWNPEVVPRTPPPLPPGSLVRAVEAFHERAAPNPGCTIGHHRHDSLPRPSRSHCETLSARPLRLLCNVLTQEAAAACPPRNPLLPRRLRRRLRIFASAAFPIPRLHATSANDASENALANGPARAAETATPLVSLNATRDSGREAGDSTAVIRSNEGHKVPLPKGRLASRSSDAARTTPAAPGTSEYYLKLAGKFLASSRPQLDHLAEPAVETTGVDVRSLQRLTDHRRAGDPADILGLLSEMQWAGILQSYQEECGLQYPCLDLEELNHEIRAANRSIPGPNHPLGGRSRSDAAMHRQQLGDIALLVCAIVSILADPKAIDVADATVDEIHAAALVKTHLSSIDLDDLTLLVLTSIYFFLSDREQQAWRAIGMVMRLLQELGYHTSRSSGAGASSSKTEARGSFGPSTHSTIGGVLARDYPLVSKILTLTITRRLPYDNSISSAYVKHMVAYCRIASDVRKSIQEQSASTQGIQDSTRDFLDFRVIEWRRNLPARLQFQGPEDKFSPSEENRGHYRIRLTLYLRGNQMRTIIHRKSSVRPGTSSLDPSNANIMAQVAQDTIRVLVGLARDTDIYRAQHRTFNHFLQTALSSLLLAMCCTGDVDMNTCLRDAHDAMDLVKRLSTESPITRRLLDKLQYVQDTLSNLRPPFRGRAAKEPKADAPGKIETRAAIDVS